MAKPEYEFHLPTEQPWEPAGAPGFFQQIPVIRPRRQEVIPGWRAWSLGPTRRRRASFTHDFWEEVFIVRGSLTDLRLGGRFEAGFYACRPPGMPHGPYHSDEGVLMFETRYGFTTPPR